MAHEGCIKKDAKGLSASPSAHRRVPPEGPELDGGDESADDVYEQGTEWRRVTYASNRLP